MTTIANRFRAGYMGARQADKISKFGLDAVGNLTLPTLGNVPSVRSDIGVNADFATIAGIRPTVDMQFSMITEGLHTKEHTVPTGITFTRASTATRFGANGLLQSVASGTPRIDYDPVTGECKGLLIEESRTNLLTYSEQFDNADWTKARSTVTANDAAAPDGNTTADKLVEDTSDGTHYVEQFSSSLTGTFTGSVFVKKAEREGVRVRLLDDTTPAILAEAYVNLNDGTVNSSSAESVSVEYVGDDWYRISVTGTVSSTVTLRLQCLILGSATGTDATYTGDGSSGIYVWGAQLEQGAFPTSYIPTTTATVTRADENVVVDGTEFSEFYKSSEGTMVVEGEIFHRKPSGIQTVAIFGGATERIVLFATEDTGVPIFIVTDDNTTQVRESFDQLTAGQRFRITGAWADDDFAAVLDGGTPKTDSSLTLPTVAQLRLGGRGRDYLNGHIKRFTYFPSRLPDATLQKLTE